MSKWLMESETAMGSIKDVMPKMASMLNKFDPIKFPIEMSVSFLKAAIHEVTSSGKLVPNATTVTLINFSLIP